MRNVAKGLITTLLKIRRGGACVRPQNSSYVARAHTRVRPYGVKVRFGLFARLQVRRTVWINRIFQCDRKGGACRRPFAALRQNDSRKGCHYNVKDRLNFAERLDLSARFQYIICRVRACVNTNMVYKLYKDMVYTFISVKMSFGVLDAG